MAAASAAGPHLWAQSAEQRRAGRPRPRPLSRAARRTPLAAPRTGPPRAALYFRGGALATEDAAAGAATASGVTLSRLVPRPPARPRARRASWHILERAGRRSPGTSQPSRPRAAVEKGRGARWSPTAEGPLCCSASVSVRLEPSAVPALSGALSLGDVLCSARNNQYGANSEVAAFVKCPPSVAQV